MTTKPAMSVEHMQLACSRRRISGVEFGLLYTAIVHITQNRVVDRYILD